MLYVSNLVVGLEGGLDDPGFLTRAADPVGAGIELFLHVHSPAYLERMEEAAAWLGDRPRTTHGPFIGVEATAPAGTLDHGHLLDAYRYAFETAARLGSRHMVFHTNQRVIAAPERPAAQRACLCTIEELLKMAEAWGVKLLIENLGIQRRGVCLFEQEAFLQLFDRFPEADCIIDVGHLHVAGWSAQRVLEALGARIAAYHFHNNDGALDSHRRIGDGTFDYERFMALYRRYTPGVDITLEYADGLGIRSEDVTRDLRSVARWQSGD